MHAIFYYYYLLRRYLINILLCMSFKIYHLRIYTHLIIIRYMDIIQKFHMDT